MREPIPENLDAIGKQIVDAALVVHRELGPGLFESVYEVCLCDVLRERRVVCEQQVALPVRFRGKRLDAGFRIDVMVERHVIVEIKSVDALSRVFESQLLTYLRLSERRLGYLINFNVPLIKDGIRRFAL